MTNMLGWGGVKGSLQPTLRGPIAYLLGLRLMHLDKKADATDVFRTAIADAPKESALYRLATSELGKPGTAQP